MDQAEQKAITIAIGDKRPSPPWSTASRLALPVTACCVIFNHDHGRVAMVQRRKLDGWCLAGGSADHDRTPIHTVQREVCEELGLWISLQHFHLFAIDSNERRDRLHAFVCEVSFGDDDLNPGRGEMPARWAPWPEVLDPGVNPYADHLAGIGLREIFK